MNEFKVVNQDILQNIAENLSKKELERIGQIVYDGYRRDLDSRTEWESQREKMAKLFAVNRGGIELRWENASNLGLPILTTACVQFQARAFAELIPGKEILKTDHIGENIEDKVAANRVQKYMNYQLDYEMDEYRESMDTTFLKLPIDGTVIRKSWFDPIKNRIVSDWVSGYDFIVNNSCRYLSQSERHSENLWLSPNEVQINMKNGVYLKYDGMNLGTQRGDDDKIKNQYLENLGTNNDDFDESVAPRHLIEQHIYLDLKDNGDIKEPYVITIDYETKNVLRIVSRRNPIYTDEIMEYYTPFHFIPNPDGFYGYGFGLLLKDANEAMNKIINDLIDCGTLQNNPMGLLLEGAGFKKEDFKLKMGEYKSVKLKTDDIRKALLPLNVAQPSQVLFALLGTLQDYQNRLTTVTETQTGDLAKSGTSATAVAAAVEQGQKVFNSIHRRIYWAMGREFQKIYRLNSLYIDIDKYYDIVIDPNLTELQDGRVVDPNTVKEVISEDFSKPFQIKPVADVSVVSRQEKAAKAQLLRTTVLEYQSQLPQSTDPQALYMATVNYLRSVDIDSSIIRQVINPPQEPKKPDLPQSEENFLFFKGQYTEPLPEQNHEEHLNEMADFKDSVYFSQLTPEGQAMFEQHQREHVGYVYLQESTEMDQQNIEAEAQAQNSQQIEAIQGL
jgi:phosphoribosyl-AMP cyclohydrolase